MKIVKRKRIPIETIMVAGEEVRIEGTWVDLYEITRDWKKEISSKWHFESLVEYREKKKQEYIDMCDKEINHNTLIVEEIKKITTVK